MGLIFFDSYVLMLLEYFENSMLMSLWGCFRLSQLILFMCCFYRFGLRIDEQSSVRSNAVCKKSNFRSRRIQPRRPWVRKNNLPATWPRTIPGPPCPPLLRLLQKDRLSWAWNWTSPRPSSRGANPPQKTPPPSRRRISSFTRMPTKQKNLPVSHPHARDSVPNQVSELCWV